MMRKSEGQEFLQAVGHYVGFAVEYAVQPTCGLLLLIHGHLLCLVCFALKYPHSINLSPRCLKLDA